MNKQLSPHQPQIIFLMGPTASGKTKLAEMISRHLPVEIISVDSALIYRDMNIGTAKPSSEELKLFPHRLIDIRDPADVYSVSDFRNDALNAIADIISTNRIPLLVGGTMFYFKILLEGLSPLPKSDYRVRTNLKQYAENVGWQVLYKQLCQLDPIAAKRIHPNDRQRIIRALEVFIISGKNLTEITKVSGEKINYKVHQFAVVPSTRTLLNKKIEQRFYHMLSAGFEDEVNMLFARQDLHIDMQSTRCVGYRQMWYYLSGKISYDDMVLHGVHATQQLAKRQITWLKKWSNIHWLCSDEFSSALEKILRVMSMYIR